MGNQTCSVEGCNGQVIARGWCGKHYARWYSNGDPLAAKKKQERKPKEQTFCTIPDCGRFAETRGMCNMHYTRWSRHGDPNIVKRERNRNGVAPCSEDGCEEVSRTNGMCNRHYRLWMYSQRGECSVEGCTTTWSAKGLCHKHYLRLRNTGTTDDPPETPLRGSCRVDGCNGLVKARDLCGQHLQRWYRFGDTELPEGARWVRQRTCRYCKQTLPADQFTVAAAACIDCLPAHRAELARKRLVRTKEIREYEAALREKQKGLCAICKIREAEAPKGRLHLDHDVETQAIRGLLCGNCNNGIGLFKHDPDLLAAAIRYLEAAGLFAA